MERVMEAGLRLLAGHKAKTATGTTPHALEDIMPVEDAREA